MLVYDIPGIGNIQIEHVVFDYNGTVAGDGEVRQTVMNRLVRINESVKVHILTADTYGTVRENFKGLGIDIHILGASDGGMVTGREEKMRFVESLGSGQTICLGNGKNDVGMLQCAALSIAVIGPEGCSSEALVSSDLVVHSIEDGLSVIEDGRKMKATLRI